MPAGKRQQSNTMLYTVIVFVALFLISTVFAVVFYVKAEDYRNSEDQLQRKMDEFVARSERSKVSALVGSKENSQSYLNALVGYHSQTAQLVLGMPSEDTPVKVKADVAASQTRNIIAKAQPFIPLEKVDPNTGLVQVMEKLITSMTNTQTTNANLTQQVADLQQQMEGTIQVTQETEQRLTQEKTQYQEQAQTVSQRYDELMGTWEKKGDDRAATIQGKLDQEKTTAKNLNQELLKTKAQLNMTQERMSDAVTQVRETQPIPDVKATTHRPDGKITVVNDPAGVVYINLGSQDRVYQGLTFSVYDKANAIPKDGKSKAEIEIFRISETSATARIISADPRNPVATGDVVANLIWDRDITNTFVIVGDFDLNGDGFRDADAVERITRLITHWGGEVTTDVSASSFAVLAGDQPHMPGRPTFEDLEVDPLAQDRYDAAQQRMDTYNQIQENAQNLMVPVYEYEKFLYLIGYKGSAGKSWAFNQ